jgi:hypothetical protein
MEIKRRGKQEEFSFLLNTEKEIEREIEGRKDATGSSETFVRVYQTTLCHVSEGISPVSISGNDVRSCAYISIFFLRISPVWGPKILEVCGGWRGWLIDIDNDFICLIFIGTAQPPECASLFCSLGSGELKINSKRDQVT